MLQFNILKNGKMPIHKECFEEEFGKYEGAFCPYCGEQMYYVECYLKTPIKNENYDPNSDDNDSPTLAFNAIWECIQVNDENYNGCGAKFSLQREEIGYYEYNPRAEGSYETTSCSSILYPELNEVRK